VKIAITDAIVPVDRPYQWSGEASFAIAASINEKGGVDIRMVLCKKKRLTLQMAKSLVDELRDIANELEKYGRKEPLYDEIPKAHETTSRVYET